MIKELTFLYELVLEAMDKGHLPFQAKRDELIAHLESLRNKVQADVTPLVGEVKTAVADTAEKVEESVEPAQEVTETTK